jgi:[ribosomal protein S5]-alanine N-acetyltransferase
VTWPIHTPRLTLRPPRDDDADALFALASSATLTRYMAWPRHASLENTRDFLAFSHREWARWPVGPLVIEDREHRSLVGTTGLAFETPYRASTGYVLGEPFWHRGLATEALNAVADLARHVGVQRLYAHCHVEHTASARVLERGGFEREGILRKYALFPNLPGAGPQDVFSYSKTA